MLHQAYAPHARERLLGDLGVKVRHRAAVLSKLDHSWDVHLIERELFASEVLTPQPSTPVRFSPCSSSGKSDAAILNREAQDLFSTCENIEAMRDCVRLMKGRIKPKPAKTALIMTDDKLAAVLSHNGVCWADKSVQDAQSALELSGYTVDIPQASSILDAARRYERSTANKTDPWNNDWYDVCVPKCMCADVACRHVPIDRCDACGDDDDRDLLCCDGCEKAFHANCLEPAVDLDTLPVALFCMHQYFACIMQLCPHHGHTHTRHDYTLCQEKWFCESCEAEKVRYAGAWVSKMARAKATNTRIKKRKPGNAARPAGQGRKRAKRRDTENIFTEDMSDCSRSSDGDHA